VFAPGDDGRPGGWAVIHPLPGSAPTYWHELVDEHGGQCALWLTARTAGICYSGQQLVDLLEAAAADGHVFGTRAAVIP
jgi:hypothetical protein